MLQYSENRCVFSKHLKLSLPRSGSLKLYGREFESDGPATEKDRGPSVLSRHRGTTNRRRLADRRCCLAETSDTGTQRSARYRGDWPCKQLYIATPSLYLTLSGTSSLRRLTVIHWPTSEIQFQLSGSRLQVLAMTVQIHLCVVGKHV